MRPEAARACHVTDIVQLQYLLSTIFWCDAFTQATDLYSTNIPSILSPRLDPEKMCITGRFVCGHYFCGGPPIGPRIAPVVEVWVLGIVR